MPTTVLLVVVHGRLGLRSDPDLVIQEVTEGLGMGSVFSLWCGNIKPEHLSSFSRFKIRLKVMD